MTDSEVSKKANVKNSLGLFILSIVAVMSIRWILYEPFVIPSGSMIPTLLINDHIVVSKYSYGVRWPFTSRWMLGPDAPKRGDIVVFRSVESDNFYMIKRVVGLPGDYIEFTAEGDILVNDEKIPREATELPKQFSALDLGGGAGAHQAYLEQMGEQLHMTLLEPNAFRYTMARSQVLPGRIFLMGDNRDRSRDSRFWGDVPLENLLGKAQFVWLSCEKTLSEVQFLCDPRTIRWQRFFQRIQ